MRRLAFPACALALCACGPDLASPFSAVAVTYDVKRQGFKLAQVRVNSLSSLRHLQGSIGTVTAGGTVTVRAAAITPEATVDSLRAAFTKVEPAQVDLAWNVLDDIVYPEDFASLELLSTYYNLEKARNALAGWGLTTLPARPIVAHASVTDERGLPALADGELYYAPMATFFAPAATARQQMPPAFNLGAVAHALGHQAVQELVWGGAPAAAPELAGDDTARHLARSMAEGLADYLGVAVSEDPRWFDHSLQQDAPARALDGIRCGTPDMLAALAVPDAQVPYDPYPLGTVLAGALWEEASASTQQDTSTGVLQALVELGRRTASGALTLAGVLDALAATAADAQRADLCGLFLNRFAQLGIQPADLPSCVKPLPHTECQ